MKPSSVFLADFIYYTLVAVALLFVLGPYWVLRLERASEVWQWAAMALGVLLLVLGYWTLPSLQRVFPKTATFVRAAHSYAKRRRDLSLDAKSLTVSERLCACGLLILAVSAAVASTVALIHSATFSSGPLRPVAIAAAFLAGLLIQVPVQMTALRICYHFGLRLADRIQHG